MEFLIDNPLASLPGPYFLVFYGFVIASSILVLAIVKAQLDKTDRLPTPPIPPKIDPFEIAYLRGGANEMARAVVFSLYQKGFIQIENGFTFSNKESASKITRVKNGSDRSELSEIELKAYDWFGVEREPKEIFTAYGLIFQLQQFAESYRQRLEWQQYLNGDAAINTLLPVKLTVLSLIFGLGVYKAFAALANGRFNIAFLIVFGIVGLVITFAVAKIPRVTKLGKLYLERLQIVFEDLKYKSQAPYIKGNPVNVSPQTTFAGVDPLLLSVGVFGSTILAGTVYDQYNLAFQRAQASGGSSSCGSSCGSSSGGSSDGGGSSCGGGCGGCGGGCGG